MTGGSVSAGNRFREPILYYYPSYSLRAATIHAARPLRLQAGYVGQDGILRPIGNRPSDELASSRKRRVANLFANAAQVANLPYIAPDSSSIWLNADR